MPAQHTTLEESGFKVDLLRFTKSNPGRPNILILPPTGGMTLLDSNMAKKLCRAGFDATILKRWSGDNEKAEDLGLHQRLFTKAMRAIELTLKSYSSSFHGILGTSVGGCFTAVAMNQFPQLNAAFVIAAGIPIPSIIVQSDHPSMRHLYKARFEKYGFKNDEEYLRSLAPQFHLDPLQTPPLFRGKKLGLSIVTRDTMVPTADQKKLMELWNPETIFQIKAGHFWGIVGTWWKHDRDIVRFFLEANKNTSPN